MKLYSAQNLDDIAENFEATSNQLLSRAKMATTQKQAEDLKSQAQAWAQAAQVLRDTEIAQ